MKSDKKPINKVKIHQIGHSLMLLLNKTERDWLNLNKKTELKSQIENGKHGKYISIWNDDQ